MRSLIIIILVLFCFSSTLSATPLAFSAFRFPFMENGINPDSYVFHKDPELAAISELLTRLYIIG